jgi:hypothetical protein
MSRYERFSRKSSAWKGITFAILTLIGVSAWFIIYAALSGSAIVAIGAAIIGTLLSSAALQTSHESKRWKYLAKLERNFETIETLDRPIYSDETTNSQEL